MFIYPIIFILCLFLAVRYLKVFQLDGLSKWTMPSVFLIKFAVGLLLFWIHIETYGIGELSHDGETFLREGKYLNDVFFQSPKHYFQLLLGIGDTTTLINKYLYMTQYWSAGDLTIINDSKNVIRVHSIIHFFSTNSVFIHLAVMCLLTLIAVKNFYISFKPFSKQSDKFTFWFLLLIPSTIFWTSSLLKEPLLFLGLSFLARALIVETDNYKKLFQLGLALALLLGFKPYVLVCVLLALIGLGAYRYLFKLKLIPTLLFLISFTFLTGAFFEKPRDTVVHYLSRKQFDFVNVGKGGLHVLADTCFYYFQPSQYSHLQMDGNEIRLLKPVDAYIVRFGSIQQPVPVYLTPKGEVWTRHYFTPGCASFIETTPIGDDTKQLIRNIPEALTNSVLRPFPNDPGSNLKFLAVMEVWFLILFLVFAIFKRRKLNNQEKGIVFTLLLFALILFLLIGWTTPVLGAITRYRFPAQLALFVVGLILLKPLKFTSWKSIFS